MLKFSIFFLCIAMVACHPNQNSNSNTNAGKSHGVYKIYLDLKEAVLAGNVKVAGDKAKELNDSLKLKVKDSDSAQVNCIRISKAENKTEQRHFFASLSTYMIELARKKNFDGNSIFIMHCPMAFNNKGADWLSDVQEIRNPYFGDEMLECGEVKEEIKN